MFAFGLQLSPIESVVFFFVLIAPFFMLLLGIALLVKIVRMKSYTQYSNPILGFLSLNLGFLITYFIARLFTTFMLIVFVFTLSIIILLKQQKGRNSYLLVWFFLGSIILTIVSVLLRYL